MLIRYRTTETGEQEKLADIFTKDDHGLGREAFDTEALYIMRRLNGAGYDAYVVGGAIRDLLLGKKPKDYDVVTNALPRKIRRIFRNSRIIGRRFQLVHVYFQNKIIEVSTFRTSEPADSHNIFGTMAEDVRRRDFTFNALYYDPKEEYIIDYVGGYCDIIDRRLRALVPLDATFKEDPVRMIRAIRYASTTGIRLTGKVSKQIKRNAALIDKCPMSRLTEELFKMLESGQSKSIFAVAHECEVLARLMPRLAKTLDKDPGGTLRESLFLSLEELDRRLADRAEVRRSDMILALAKPLLGPNIAQAEDLHVTHREIFHNIKRLIAPLTPPNAEIERSVDILLGIKHGTIARSRRRTHHRRRPREKKNN